jgi:hypothetical protein
MGELKKKRAKGEDIPSASSTVNTPNGRIQVRRDAGGEAAPLGQLAYFIEFLTRTGLWTEWLESSIGRRTEHAGQTSLTITAQHAHFAKAKALLMRLSGWLQRWSVDTAEQLSLKTVWQRCCDFLKQIIALQTPVLSP